MNNIGFGIFCFGEEYYFKGTVDKIKHILNEGYHCYILTDTPEYFTTIYSSSFIHIIQYDRNFKSYSDKMILPKKILKNHDISILIDADTHITDYSFLNNLKTYSFKGGVSYIDTLLNHSAKKEFVKDLINETNPEWKTYVEYASKLYPPFFNFETMWEYFLVINKNGFDVDSFYHYYEKLQIVKEYSDLPLKKEISGAGEGISIQISCKSANIEIQRDIELYKLIEGKMISISRRYTPRHLWPNWMK
jgi:hypothetical protein